MNGKPFHNNDFHRHLSDIKYFRWKKGRRLFFVCDRRQLKINVKAINCSTIVRKSNFNLKAVWVEEASV